MDHIPNDAIGQEVSATLDSVISDEDIYIVSIIIFFQHFIFLSGSQLVGDFNLGVILAFIREESASTVVLCFCCKFFINFFILTLHLIACFLHLVLCNLVAATQTSSRDSGSRTKVSRVTHFLSLWVRWQEETKITQWQYQLFKLSFASWWKCFLLRKQDP